MRGCKSIYRQWLGHRTLDLALNGMKNKEEEMSKLTESFDFFIKSSRGIIVDTMSNLFILTWEQKLPAGSLIAEENKTACSELSGYIVDHLDGLIDFIRFFASYNENTKDYRCSPDGKISVSETYSDFISRKKKIYF